MIVTVLRNDGTFVEGTAEYKGKKYAWTAWHMTAFNPPRPHVVIYGGFYREGRKVSNYALKELREKIIEIALPNP